MKELRVLNIYKILMSVHMGLGGSPKSVSFYRNLIKAKHFSEIPDSDLPLVLDHVSYMKKHLGTRFQFVVNCCVKYVEPELLKSCKLEGDMLGFLRENFIRNNNDFKATIERFEEDLKKEQESRNKHFSKLAGSKNITCDDNMLLIFEKKAQQCKNLDDVADLFSLYTTRRGSDLINGFLRGDIHLGETGNSKVRCKKGSWETNLETVGFSELLDIVIKALKLKGEIAYGTLDDITKVYRGLGFEHLLKYTGGMTLSKLIEKYYEAFKQALIPFVNPNDEKNKQFWECIDKKTDLNKVLNFLDSRLNYKVKKVIYGLLVKYVEEQNPIYQLPSFISTSLSEKVAWWHARRQDSSSPFANVVMSITLQKGTAFGKDISKLVPGNESNKEVILKPGQKIKLTNASFNKHMPAILIDAETIK